jgi:hypothetical protein
LTLPKAADHEIGYWRGSALILGIVGMACWPIHFVGGAVVAFVFLVLAFGCWALTRERE